MFKGKVIFLILSIVLITNISAQAKSNPTAANYNAELGLNYLQQGDVERAKSKLWLALKQDPHNPIVQDAMGFFLEQTGETQQAQNFYLKALTLAPHSGIAQNNYGTFLCRQGQYQQSIQHFLLATQDLQYLHTSQAYENAGLCALKIPDIRQAENFLHKANKADPGRASPLLELAKLSYNQQHYQAAKVYLTRYFQRAKPPAAQAEELKNKLASKGMHITAI